MSKLVYITYKLLILLLFTSIYHIANFLGMEPVVGDSLYKMIIAGILPFNIVKGVLLTAIMVLLFTTMRRWIEQQRTMYLSK
ncbi:hypothetical protein ACIP9G_09480 [Lysinibacillus sp. NPDC093197]|uniref:hypothetical protein n=1 Tax=Lysinibacillus sp. NPDC093197 TaxID=3364132 RepID=UPI003801EA2C